MTYFELDLLKGECVPVKSQPIIVAVALVPLLVVLLLVAGMLMGSVREGITVAGKEKQLLRLGKQIEALAGEVAYTKSRTMAIGQSNAEMADVEKQILLQVQYTPIFKTVAGELPENLVLTTFDVVPMVRQKNRPDPNDQTRMITSVVTERTIHITVCDVAEGESVSNYVMALRQSPAMSWMIESIEPTARNSASIAGREVVSYDIDCKLLPQ
jgi:hypothetical protein